VLNNVQTVSTDPISSGVCAGAPATHLTSTCVPVGEIANQYVEIPAEETDFNAGFFQGVEGAMGIKGAVNMTMFDPATIPAGDVGFDEIYLVSMVFVCLQMFSNVFSSCIFIYSIFRDNNNDNNKQQQQQQ
jgi:hypothetical protein